MNAKTERVTKQLNDALEVAEDVLKGGEQVENEIIEAESHDVEVIEHEDNLPQPLYDQDLIRDYQDTRKSLKRLVEKAEKALDTILHVANESEHPRVFEVAGYLIKTIAEVSKDVLQLQETMLKLRGGAPKNPEDDDGEAGVTIGNAEQVNNIVFTGTTADLQQLIKEAKKATDGK